MVFLRRTEGPCAIPNNQQALFAVDLMDLPFYFPISVMLLDDDLDVLDATAAAFGHILPGRNIYRMGSCRDALAYLAANALTFNALPKDVDFDSATAQVEAKFEQREGGSLAALEEHHNQVGIVIVDYAMPQMNGVEFCRRISSHAVQKILLTGQATPKDALKAFNDGLIDRYVPKQHPGALQKLRDYVVELEAQFFRKMNRQFAQLIGNSALPYISNDSVALALNALCASLDVKTCAPSFSPPGIFVRTAAGERLLLVVVDSSYIAAAIEIAEVDRVSTDVIRLIQNRTHVYLPDLEDWSGAHRHGPRVFPISPLSPGTFYCKLPLAS